MLLFIIRFLFNLRYQHAGDFFAHVFKILRNASQRGFTNRGQGQVPEANQMKILRNPKASVPGLLQKLKGRQVGNAQNRVDSSSFDVGKLFCKTGAFLTNKTAAIHIEKFG